MRAPVTIALAMLTVGVVACAAPRNVAAPGSAQATTSVETTMTPTVTRLHIEVGSGCPAQLPYYSPAANWDELIDNPDQTGLSDTLVPGVPSAVLVCRYSSATSDAGSPPRPNNGQLFGESKFNAQTAVRLARSANAAPSPTNNGHSGCIALLNSIDRVTAIVVAVPRRADVNVWYPDGSDDRAQTTGCSPPSNRPRTGTDGPPAFFHA